VRSDKHYITFVGSMLNGSKRRRVSRVKRIKRAHCANLGGTAETAFVLFYGRKFYFL